MRRRSLSLVAWIGALVLGVVTTLAPSPSEVRRASPLSEPATAEPAPPEALMTSASDPLPLFEARTTYTREFGLPRPVAVAFDPHDGSLLLTGPADAGARLLRLEPAADEPLGSLTLLPGEPSTMAFDALTGRLTMVAGRDLVIVPRERLSERRPGVRRISLRGVGLRNPSGATYDGSGNLLVLDRGTIVRIERGDPRRGISRIRLHGLPREGLRGLAHNPADGLLYTLNVRRGILYGFDLTPSVRTRYELSSLELRRPGGIAFAPSADPTDDPDSTSLFVADAGSAELYGGTMEVRLEAAPVVDVPTVSATLVRTIETWKFNPASPDPSGVTYMPGPDRLMIVDSEVDEVTGAGYHGVNMWELTRTGTVTGTGTTLAFSSEPTGVSYAPSIDTLFISSDLSCCNGVFIVRRGPDGKFGTPDDVVSFFNAKPHGSNDTEDPEYDPSTGHLFFLWGAGTTVFRVDPVNGVFGDGDDVVTSFDVGQYGALDIEALALDQARNTLLVGERKQDKIYELTKGGELLRIIDTSGVSAMKRISGLGMAPASDNSGRMNVWITDRAADNDANPDENDGMLFELSVPSPAGNTPPVIDSLTIDPIAPRTNDVVRAEVTAHDSEGDALTFAYQWFKNGATLPGATTPTLDLSRPGNGDRGDVVSVRVTAFDGTVWSSPRESAATVENSPPVFNQDLPDRTDGEGQAVTLSAGATDADGDTLTYGATGLPPGISINAATGQISGSIAVGAGSGSPYPVTVSARDGATPTQSDVAQVQRKAGDQTLATSISLTFDQPPTQGNLLVAFGSYGSNRAPTIPPGWSLALETNTGPETVVFYKVAGQGEPSTVPLSISGSETRISLATFEYAGLSASQGGVLDRVVFNTAAGATSVSTGTTQPTTQGDELLMASVAVGGNRSFQNTWTNGFQRQTVVPRQTVAHRVVSAAGQFETTESWDSSSGAVAALVTFKAAASGELGAVTDTFTWTVAGASPPASPTLVAPGNGSTGASTSPTLDVVASDPDGGNLSVSFYGRALASGRFTLIGTANGVPSGGHATVTWSSIGGGQTFEWYATVRDDSATTQGPTWTFRTAPGPDPVFIGAGDIAKCSSSGDEATAAVVAGVDGTVFTTGDNAYDDGTLADFMNCYEPSWGRFKERTRPIPGNRDWGVGVTNSLSGYFTYFGANATDANGKSYYSYDLNSSWHVVNLDSECSLVPGGCAAGSPQAQWLAADLAANADKNVIALWHRPFFSSGGTDESRMRPMVEILYGAGVDLALVGHDHIYERLAPMNPAGQPDPAYGIRHFVVGSGGSSHHPAGTPLPTSEALNDTTYGVLKLTLHATSYDWKFLPVEGETFTDSGTGTVHGPPGGNRPPIFDQDLPNRTDPEGAVVSFSASATDPDGDPLTYAATGLPPGISIHPATGQITGTIAAGASASSPYSVSVTVRDGPAVDATDTFTWTVTNTNRDPTFDQDLPDRTDPEGAVVSISASATDPDGDPLTYAATGLPPGISIHPATGQITGTIAAGASASSPYSVSVTVRDGPAVDATDTFTWTVTATPPSNTPPAAPTGLSATASTVGIRLRWDAGQEADLSSYRIYRAPSQSGPFTLLDSPPATSTSYLDLQAALDATSFYRVTAVNANENESPPAGVSTRRGAIAFRGSSSASVNRGSTLSIARPAGVAVGDTMLAAVMTAGTPAVTPPAGWTMVAEVAAQGGQIRMVVFAKLSGPTEPSSFAWSLSGKQSAVGQIVAYEGVSATSPIDASAAQANPPSTSITAPSVTATVEEGVLLAFFGIDVNSTIELPSGMIEQIEVSATGKEKVTSAAGDEVVMLGPTGQRVAISPSSAVNVGVSIVLRPRS